MQVIGICRFSYPGMGGFQVKHETIEERIAYLYTPDRMEERFRTFECFTLPALRAQTDPDFTFLIVVGEQMPEAYLLRLMALVQDMPQAVIQPHPPGRHRQVMQAAINTVRQFDGEPCLQFRMDDDDAVAVNFVESLRATAQDVKPFAARHHHIGIDFNQGFIVRAGAKGIYAAPTQIPYTTPGLGFMVQNRIRLSIMNFSHVKMAQKMPTVTLTGQDMMMRGHNQYNDSRQGSGVKPADLALLDGPGETHFRATYNIDADHVRRVYADSKS